MRLFAAAALLAGAPAAAPAAVPRDAGPYEVLAELVASGQRWAGAPRRAEAVGGLEAMLRRRGLKVARQSFESADPRSGRLWPMTNVIGRLRPAAPCRFLLGTHFDTRHVAESDPDPALRERPIEGANDGGSGVAVLVSLAGRLKGLLPKGVGADVALFDGEEMGYPGVGGYMAGSRHFAERLDSLKAKPKFAIILDMVCSPSAPFRIETFSQRSYPALLDALWEIGGRRAGPGAFERQVHGPIGDDHLPLIKAGVPSVLVIGMTDPNWHTSRDVLARCSAERLQAVAETLAEFVQKRAPALLDCR